jgi:multisubunit Na+/H+ antiporter MnhB subunit
MNVTLMFDLLLCLIVVAVALGTVAGRDLFAGIALYIVYGLLLAIAWVRLGAVDVALAEGAIGAGLTGVLLLGALGRIDGHTQQRLRLRPVTIALCFALAGGLGWAVLTLPEAGAGLHPLVEANLEASGVGNPVTAVLLNFRGWDTLLEAMVLLVALVAVWSLTADDLWGGRPGLRQHVRPDGVLATFGRFLLPLGLVIGIYLVWVGTSAPGGAFQAGTVLAAVWLLAMMAGLIKPPAVSNPNLRWLLIAGPLLFLGAGLFGLTHGAFLRFAPAHAKELIIAIEFALTVSIAATLALLVLGPPRSTR